jgi:hypothetical protein
MARGPQLNLPPRLGALVWIPQTRELSDFLEIRYSGKMRNGWLRFVVSHIWRDKTAPDMGHPVGLYGHTWTTRHPIILDSQT